MRIIIVDGYNMTRRISRFLEAEHGGLALGREKLLFELEDYGAGVGVQVAVVFDGARRPHIENGELPAEEGFAGIDVFFSNRGQSADRKIVKIVRGILKKKRYRNADVEISDVIVVSDDITLKDEVKELGAYAISPVSLNDAMNEMKMPTY